MLSWQRPTVGQGFELWREEGILRLDMVKRTRLGIDEMKELIRLMTALYPIGRTPVMIDLQEGVVMEQAARALVCRVFTDTDLVLAVITTDLECRLQCELFKRLQRPAFRIRVFGARDEGRRWLREQLQLSVLR